MNVAWAIGTLVDYVLHEYIWVHAWVYVYAGIYFYFSVYFVDSMIEAAGTIYISIGQLCLEWGHYA